MKNVNNIRSNEWIALFVGIAITVVYIIFATPLYDLIYPGSAQFSNEMYNLNMYFIIAILTSCIVWLIALIYYVLIDRWTSFWAWFISLIIAMVCAPCIAYVYPDGEFTEMDIDLSADLVNFAIANLFVTAVLYFIISLCVKGISRNCATTPF